MSHPFSWPEWQRMDALDLATHVRSGNVTASEVAGQAAAAVEIVDPQLSAVLEIFQDAVADPVGAGAVADGVLFGVPMLVKDSGSGMAGRLREWGSRLTRGQRALDDCPVTSSLRCAGLNLLGRTTLPESGKAFDTTFDYQGQVVVTRNPWDTSRTPGGSSGGSAAILASGAVPVARSGDAAGSTRVPASFTGLVGHKPSRGLIPPPRGTSELTNHRVQEGVLTRTVRDQAALLDIMTRPVSMAHFISAPRPAITYLDQIRYRPQRLRVAVSSGAWGLPGSCDTFTAARVTEVANLLADLGHHPVDINDAEICDWEPFWSDVRTNWIATGWFWRSLANQRGWPLAAVRELLTPQNANLLDAGEGLTVGDIRAALTGNTRLMTSLGRFFQSYDVMLCPTFAGPVPLANGDYSLLSSVPFDTWFANLLHGMRYTVLANESGLPALTLPTGRVEGLPVGAMVYGTPLSDGTLLQLAAEIENARPDWFNAAPPVSVLRAAT
jgi:amidase